MRWLTRPARSGLDSWYSFPVPRLIFYSTDDGILTAIGNPAEFKGERRNQFVLGLKAVLTGLRARKIRDFDVIAREVIAHRAEFLGDPSKILVLD